MVETARRAKDRKLRVTCSGSGYDEAVSLTFHLACRCEDFSAAIPMELENPLSEEASVMRTSIVPGMLNMLSYNLNRGNDNVRLFEAGHVYEAEGLVL